MRRIEFIAPVEAMRGNLSGSQTLVYADNNNPAWDAPDGRQAARNYTTRYIGTKRSSDGYKGFSVRTKNIINNTENLRRAQALLGGSAICFNVASVTLSVMTQLQAAYVIARDAQGGHLTYRKWLQGLFYNMLENKQATLVVRVPSMPDTIINNPWYEIQSTGGVNLDIPQKDLLKFFPYLAKNGIVFKLITIDGVSHTGVAFSGMTFGRLIASPWNTLQLQYDSEGSGMVYFNGSGIVEYLYTHEAEDYVPQTLAVEALTYYTTTEAPE